MKVLEIIELAKWVDGSGYSYTETYSSKITDIVGDTAEEIKANFDWSWWEKSEPVDGEDLEITVKYYRPDYYSLYELYGEVPDVEPIAEFEIWESKIPY